MKTYVIEREVPGAGQLSSAELTAITTASNDAVVSLDRPYEWLHSYAAGDKLYCVHRAESAEDIAEHARIGGFPANRITEVTTVFDPTGPRGTPR